MKPLIAFTMILLSNPLFSQSDTLTTMEIRQAEYQAAITYTNTLITARKWYYRFNPGGESVCVIGDTTYLENNQGKKKYLVYSYTIDERLDFFSVHVMAKGSTGQIRFSLMHDEKFGTMLRFAFAGDRNSDIRHFSSSQNLPAYFMDIDEVLFRKDFYSDQLIKER